MMVTRISTFDENKELRMIEELPPHEAAALFRGSSWAVKLMSEFGTILSKDYVIAVLKPSILKIIQAEGSFEINPKKLSDISARAENLERLLDACQILLDAIIASCNDAPPSFRSLMGMFASEVAKGFGNKIGFNTALGVLFLRYFCPAIVKPIEYGLLEQALSKDKISDLIYCAKILQNQANSQSFGAKEDYMSDVNEFILRNTERIQHYFAEFIQSPEPGFVIDAQAAQTGYTVAQVITVSSVNSFVIPPRPLNKADQQRDLYASKPPASHVLRASGLLRSKIAGSCIRLHNYIHAASRDIHPTSAKEMGVSEGELKAAELLSLRKGLLDELMKTIDEQENDSASIRSSNRKKEPSETKDIGFLKLLVAPDMLVAASICEMVKFSEATPVVTSLITVFNHYNICFRLVEYNVARELIITYRKWQAPKIAALPPVTFRMEGTVEMKTTSLFRRWRTRHFVLENNQLFVYSSDPNWKATEPIMKISIDRIGSVRPCDVSYSDEVLFDVKQVNGVTYNLRAPDAASMRRWVDALNQVMADQLRLKRASVSSFSEFKYSLDSSNPSLTAVEAEPAAA